MSCDATCTPPTSHPLSPSPGLVNSFCDEVCGKARLKRLLVLKGVVALGVGHAAALEPAVKHLRHSIKVPLAQLRGDGDRVNTALECMHVRRWEVGWEVEMHLKADKYFYSSSVPLCVIANVSITQTNEASNFTISRSHHPNPSPSPSPPLPSTLPPPPSCSRLSVQILHHPSRELSQLLPGAHHDHFLHVIRGPDGHGRAPVAIAGDSPVTSILQPVVEPLLLDKLRHPTTGQGGGENLLECDPVAHMDTHQA